MSFDRAEPSAASAFQAERAALFADTCRRLAGRDLLTRRDPLPFAGGLYEAPFAKNALDAEETLAWDADAVTAIGNTADNGYHSTRVTAPREIGVMLRYSFGSR